MAALLVLLPWSLGLPVAMALGLAIALTVLLSVWALRQPVTTGCDALLGAVGQAMSDLTPEGLVSVRTELWLAEAPTLNGRGGPVQALEVKGATIWVRRERAGLAQTARRAGLWPAEVSAEPEML